MWLSALDRNEKHWSTCLINRIYAVKTGWMVFVSNVWILLSQWVGGFNSECRLTQGA